MFLLAYAVVAALALPLLAAVILRSRHEDDAAARAWRAPAVRGDTLQARAELAAFAVAHAASAPRTAGPVVEAYCAETRAALGRARCWSRLSHAAMPATAARCRAGWARCVALDVSLRLLPGTLAWVIRFGRWHRLPALEAWLRQLDADARVEMVRAATTATPSRGRP